MKKLLATLTTFVLFAYTLEAQEALTEFSDGSIASAPAINNNFTYLDSRISDLSAKLQSLTDLSPTSAAVDCDIDGRGALQAKIVELSTYRGRVDIRASGTCSAIEIGGGRQFRIFGNQGPGSPLIINHIAEETAVNWLAYLAPGANVTLFGVTIDATGVSIGIRNQGAILYTAYLTIHNADRINMETLAGFTAAFGPGQFGDEDDTATALSVAAAGVFAILDGRNILPINEAVVTLRGIDLLFRLATGSSGYFWDPATRIDASGGGIRLFEGGSLHLRQANITLSDTFSISSGGSLILQSEVDDIVSIEADMLLASSGSIEADAENGALGKLLHKGGLQLTSSSSVFLRGDANQPGQISIGGQPDASQSPTLVSVRSNSTLELVDAEVHAAVEVVSGDLIVADESSLKDDSAATVTSLYDGTVLFTGAAPANRVNCNAGGTAWVSNQTGTFCSTQ